jgi:hypothetical protein
MAEVKLAIAMTHGNTTTNQFRFQSTKTEGKIGLRASTPILCVTRTSVGIVSLSSVPG